MANAQSKIGLAPYTVRVRQVREKEFLKFGSLGTGLSLLSLLHQYLDERRNFPGNHTEFNRYFGVAELEYDDKAGILSGRVQLGGYGQAGTLVNQQTNKVTHRRTIDEADLRPFYFRFECPPKSDVGVMVLQKTGSVGIRKTLVADFTKWLIGKQLDYRLVICKPCRKELLDNYVGPARVAQVHYIHRYTHSDSADAVSDGIQHDVGEVEVIVKARYGKGFDFKNRIQRWLQEQERRIGAAPEFASLLEIHADELPSGFEPADVKFNLVSGKSRNLISLASLSTFSPPHDVSDFVKRDPTTNEPVFRDLDELARKLAADVRAGVMQVVNAV